MRGPFGSSGLDQAAIEIDDISTVIQSTPRRVRLGVENTVLHAPERENGDWRLVLPFWETLGNAFYSMVPSSCHIGLRDSKMGRPYTFVKGDHGPVQDWVDLMGNYVAIRDCLALSFALDYDRQDGDPHKPHTEIGNLRTHAKTYGRAADDSTHDAAEELAKSMLQFIRKVDLYERVDLVVGVPPSDPAKNFDLPRHLAELLAGALDLPDACDSIRTIAKRAQVKNLALCDKLDVLDGTMAVDAKMVQGKRVLLVEDLYQSGATINVAAMELVRAGASAVFGLSCVKTCRNTDNVTE